MGTDGRIETILVPGVTFTRNRIILQALSSEIFTLNLLTAELTVTGITSLPACRIIFLSVGPDTGRIIRGGEAGNIYN